MDARGIIGNYIVERELGRGGMGVVYAAKHRVLGRPAAIKLLLASTSEERGRVERFFNEARAAMAIDHPGVVKIYDVGIAADDRPYIAMELLDGTALASLVSPAGLPIRQAVDYACQIASALAAAHDAGVIHRDLKPENIIITRDRSRAIVVDFGIAKLAHQATVRTATGALVGTPLYMSPEQCEGLRDLDARSDLYAFGCVIFAMLTGRPPFFEGGTGGLIGMHLHVAPPPLRSRCPNASEALERVVSVLLAKSPDARFRTARATLAALQAPEVRGLAANASGVPATADIVAGNRSVQPWAATPAVPVARHAPTMDTSASSHAQPPNAPPTRGAAPHASGSAPHASGSAPHASGPAPHASGAVPNPGVGAPYARVAPPEQFGASQAGPTPATAFGVPASRDAWTQVTGIDVRDPRTAAIHAQGTPSPASSVAGPLPSPASSVAGPLPSPATSRVGASNLAQNHGASNLAPSVTPFAATASTHPHAGPYAHPSAPHAKSRRTMLVAILASSVVTAIVAVGASRGCGTHDGAGAGRGSNVAGAGSGSNVAGAGSGSNVTVAGTTGTSGAGTASGEVAGPRVDAGALDAAVVAAAEPPAARTNEPRANDPRTSDVRASESERTPARSTPPPKSTTAPRSTPPPKSTTAPRSATPPTTTRTPASSVTIDPNGGPLPGARPRNEVPGAGIANLSDEEREKVQERAPVVRQEIREHFLFARGDHQATMGQRVLDRVAATHRLDPTRRIIITGHAEQDEPGVLDTLAGARANTAYTHLISRGVSRSVLVLSSTRYIDPATPNGTGRRVTIDFE